MGARRTYLYSDEFLAIVQGVLESTPTVSVSHRRTLTPWCNGSSPSTPIRGSGR